MEASAGWAEGRVHGEGRGKDSPASPSSSASLGVHHEASFSWSQAAEAEDEEGYTDASGREAAAPPSLDWGLGRCSSNGSADSIGPLIMLLSCDDDVAPAAAEAAGAPETCMGDDNRHSCPSPSTAASAEASVNAAQQQQQAQACAVSDLSPRRLLRSSAPRSSGSPGSSPSAGSEELFSFKVRDHLRASAADCDNQDARSSSPTLFISSRPSNATSAAEPAERRSSSSYVPSGSSGPSVSCSGLPDYESPFSRNSRNSSNTGVLPGRNSAPGIIPSATPSNDAPAAAAQEPDRPAPPVWLGWHAQRVLLASTGSGASADGSQFPMASSFSGSSSSTFPSMFSTLGTQPSSDGSDVIFSSRPSSGDPDSRQPHSLVLLRSSSHNPAAQAPSSPPPLTRSASHQHPPQPYAHAPAPGVAYRPFHLTLDLPSQASSDSQVHFEPHSSFGSASTSTSASASAPYASTSHACTMPRTCSDSISSVSSAHSSPAHGAGRSSLSLWSRGGSGSFGSASGSSFHSSQGSETPAGRSRRLLSLSPRTTLERSGSASPRGILEGASSLPHGLDRELEKEQLRAHALVYARAKGITLEQATEALELRSQRTRRKHSLPVPLPGSQQGSPTAAQVERRASASATYITSTLGSDSGIAVEQQVVMGGHRVFLAVPSSSDAADRRTT